MEPKLPSPEKIPEMPQVPGEFSPSTPEVSPESKPEYSPERATERAGEQHHATTASPAPIALPTPIQSQSDDDDAVTADDTAPLTANDDDLIEKEWVDKAKQIIAETKDDPHMREKKVNKLQADYLRKRYGKELGEAT